MRMFILVFLSLVLSLDLVPFDRYLHMRINVCFQYMHEIFYMVTSPIFCIDESHIDEQHRSTTTQNRDCL